jgi:general secretion pathway protein D
MRWPAAGICVLLAGTSLAGACLAEETPAAPVTAPVAASAVSVIEAPAVPALAPAASAPALCSNTRGAPVCQGSKSDLKLAHKAFEHGLKLEKSHDLQEAFYEFQVAADLVPQNVEYLTAREFTRQHLAGMHLEKGNNDLLGGEAVEAMAEFRSALDLDPQNEFALQRVRDALGTAPVSVAEPPQLVASADAIEAKPMDLPHDFHFDGDSRGLLTLVATSYGLKVIFDDSFPSHRVRFDLENADFGTAIVAVSQITKTFIVALEDTVLFACADTADNHRSFDRMGLRSFYVSGGPTAQDLQDLLNTMKTLFEFKFANINAASSTITLRGPQATLAAATEFLGQFNSPKPEVLLDLKVFQVSHTYMRTIGLHAPDVFNLYNIPAAALTALGGQSIQSLINQLVASGGINQAGNQSISALISQLQSQQNSIFSQPLATFGGGLTFFGLSLDMLSPVLSMNQSSVRELQHVQLRGSQNNDATFKLGERYPILNASFAPIYNNSAIASVVGNQSYTAPVPSVNYEDIGLTLKAKPTVHNNLDVSLDLDIQIRSLGSTVTNGIPDILNREYKGGMLLKEGQQAMVAGMITESDEKSLSGLPLFFGVPGLGLLTGQNTKQQEHDELLILITPHVIRNPERAEGPEIWLSK